MFLSWKHDITDLILPKIVKKMSEIWVAVYPVWIWSSCWKKNILYVYREWLA